MDQQLKEFFHALIFTFVGMVVYEVSKDTAIGGVITVAFGLFLVPFLTIVSVKFFIEKSMGSALVCAFFALISACGLWISLSHSPWHQLPQEIDKVLNIVLEQFR
ncbi:hypothetical protein [Desulfomonile tiedjei]|uniref:Uncharacterized protein n=1 Tax=Desulfomonile tiedjei (strain ATCC 49306 / DSM 6799 / DCB-1) TaxID=706587 RepID=I4C357_DESTA|nr:hypothetical protein [Desulfomonile tiedjei]AFM23998.1 hypothetical protein Desti_1285 [Desulfomonile tiedjei DSM 6799]